MDTSKQASHDICLFSASFLEGLYVSIDANQKGVGWGGGPTKTLDRAMIPSCSWSAKKYTVYTNFASTVLQWHYEAPITDKH